AVTRIYRRETPAVESAWQLVRQSNDPALVRRFADEFPTRQRTVAARQRLDDLAPARRERPAQTYTTAPAPSHNRVINACLAGGGAEECERAFALFPDEPVVQQRLCGLLGEGAGCALALLPDGQIALGDRSNDDPSAIEPSPRSKPAPTG